MTGIVVHSTGANNPYIKRYVQPSDNDPDKASLLQKIGTNRYGNSWNRPSVNKSTHFFIGRLDNGKIGTIQTLPTDICCWACGRGKKAPITTIRPLISNLKYARTRLITATIFTKYTREAVALCAELCREFSWSADVIVSHKEAYRKGYASGHGDIDHWLKKFGLKMNDFRHDVTKLLEPFMEYRVVKGNTLSKICEKI